MGRTHFIPQMMPWEIRRERAIDHNLAMGTAQPFDLIFCDPPYGKGLGERAIAAACEGGWVAPGAVAVIEERAGQTIAWPAPFQEIDLRRYGDTLVAIANAGR